MKTLVNQFFHDSFSLFLRSIEHVSPCSQKVGEAFAVPNKQENTYRELHFNDRFVYVQKCIILHVEIYETAQNMCSFWYGEKVVRTFSPL